MDNRLGFLEAAVAEAQATIRALDVKIAAMLVVTLAPLPLIASIAECLSGIYKAWSEYYIGPALVVFCLSWALIVICLALALGAISNPACHVVNSCNYRGSMFGAGIYRLSPVDALVNRAKVMSSTTPEAHLQKMPSTVDEIERELSYEHLKLIYIRDIKLYRLRWSYRLSGLAIVVGAIFYAIARYHLRECGP